MDTMTEEEMQAKAKVLAVLPDAYAAFGISLGSGSWKIRATWGGIKFNRVTTHSYKTKGEAWIEAAKVAESRV